MTSLTDMFLGKTEASAKPDATPATSLTDTFLSNSTPAKSSETPKPFDIEELRQKNRSAFVQGMKDVLNTAGSAVGYIDKTIHPKNEELYNKFQQNIKTENENFDKANPPSDGMLPTNADIGRFAGQTVATLPLMPMKAFQAVKGAMGALPRVGAMGEKIAAPFLNRMGAAAVTGGVGGAEYGALTSASNDESALSNTGKGLITGAIAGPVLAGAEAAGRNLLPSLRNMWAKVQIDKLVQQSGLEPSAVKNIINIVENAGYTPRQAQLALDKLGPSATLSDLATSISTEASGLASIGGKPTEILKSRYEARGKTANSNASQIMETQLGPKPNIEAEKEAIIKQVQKDVDPDYKKAYRSGDTLNTLPVIDNIDAQLKTAVGPKKNALVQLKDYMYNENGTLKNDIPSLHEVRQAIDDVINNKNPTTSYGKNALRSIESVRGDVDKLLKSHPAMEAADNKFAEKMEIVKSIDNGYNVLSGSKNGMNKEEFAKMFDAANPEHQEAIKKGLRAKIGDLMERASRGELSEAQRLFGKSSLNRANIEKAFGNKGTEVLDALQKEATERATENAVRHGAQTAERQSIQSKYGVRENRGGGLKDAVQGAVLDVVTGTPGGATALMTAKRMGGNAALKISEGRRERLIEGTADLISRQGTSRDLGLDVANRVKKIQSKIGRTKSLPVDVPSALLAGPTGQLSYSGYKNANKE